MNLEQLLESRNTEEMQDDPRLSEALVSEYGTFLERLALSILNDPDDAEDVVQEVFLSALTHLHQYERGTSFKNWLATITVNRCRDQLRRKKARLTLQAILGAWMPHPEHPEEVTMSNEQNRSLWAVVQRLDEKHRLPIVLRFVHSMPVGEIAQVLGVREGTVHSRLHYALQKLQKELKDFNGFSVQSEQEEGSQ